MSQVLVILAHPQLQRSRVNRAMFNAIQNLSGVAIHDIYEMYPDYYIDLSHEKVAMTAAHTIILQHPFQWYSCPSLMKEWIDVVLQKGWAYGPNGTALQGKRLLNAISTGGSIEAYRPDGRNRFTMTELMKPYDQTAHHCGMSFMEPFVFYSALTADQKDIDSHAQAYRDLVQKLATPPNGDTSHK